MQRFYRSAMQPLTDFSVILVDNGPQRLNTNPLNTLEL